MEALFHALGTQTVPHVGQRKWFLVYLMRRMGFTKTECKQLVAGYESILEKYRAELPFNIYSKLIKTSAHGKVTALRQFVSDG